MAPPIAAQRLERDPIALRDLVAEIDWRAGTQVGLVETVGGVRSPLADDGDSRGLIDALGVDHVILVADAGLGAINSVRLAVDGLAARSLTVVLNRFAADDAVHRSNLEWLTDRDRLPVVTEIAACVATLRGLVSIGPSDGDGKLTG
jgi:dethiobiotin synthetase